MTKELNPAKVAAICFVFLVVLYFNATIDLALSIKSSLTLKTFGDIFSL